MTEADMLFGADHIRRYEETDGEVGHIWNGAPTLVLHTIGRTSGEVRKFALIYGRDGDEYLLVASNGGADDHPGWYKNLLAHPDVDIQVLGETFPVTARPATAAEKARLWPSMVVAWPAYDDYQASTDRDIPVVILTRR